jgi:AraC family transcriptional regulator of adaptative response / DNA-3-methyladenine glycosylase II
MRVELPGYEGLLQVVERARRLFDLDAAPDEIGAHLRRSRLLRPLVDRSPGLRIPGAWDPFEVAVRAVLEQALTVVDATALAGRLAQRWGEPTPVGGAELSSLFPKPARLAEADLSQIGVPRGCAETLSALASRVASGGLPLDASRGLEDAVARLRAIRGLRASTAHYIAMRALGEPDALPWADGALPNGATGRAALSRMAEAWRPWRAYAAMHLWAAAHRERAIAPRPADRRVSAARGAARHAP